MSTTSAALQPRAAAGGLAVLKDLVALGKPRLSGLVVFTTASGMWLAPGHLPGVRAVLAVLATAGVVGAANALNNYLERETDGLMRRTRDRALPAGRLEPSLALLLGLVVPAFSLPVLRMVGGPLPALLALLALALYVLVYTPMKRRSSAALFVGAVPGALPPLIGWTAVTGRVDAGGLALFALLFAWQLPHFLAISIYLKEDYARGGHRVFALVHGERLARAGIAASSLALLPIALLPSWLGLAGWGYGLTAGVATAALAGAALAGLGRRGEGTRWARGFFLGTLAWLTVVMAALFAGAGA